MKEDDFRKKKKKISYNFWYFTLQPNPFQFQKTNEKIKEETKKTCNLHFCTRHPTRQHNPTQSGKIKEETR